MGCRDVGFRFGAGGQQGGADVVEAGVALKEPTRHLRLTGQTAEIDDGASMGQRCGTDAGGIGCTVGSGNGAIGFGRWRGVRVQDGVNVESLGSTKSFHARVRGRTGNRWCATASMRASSSLDAVSGAFV